MTTIEDLKEEIVRLETDNANLYVVVQKLKEEVKTLYDQKNKLLKENEFTGFLVAVVVTILTTAIIFAAKQMDTFKEQAVKRGFAKWVVSSAGNVEWGWKEVAK